MTDYFKQATNEYNRGLRRLKRQYNRGEIDKATYDNAQAELYERTEGATGRRASAEKSIAASYNKKKVVDNSKNDTAKPVTDKVVSAAKGTVNKAVSNTKNNVNNNGVFSNEEMSANRQFFGNVKDAVVKGVKNTAAQLVKKEPGNTAESTATEGAEDTQDTGTATQSTTSLERWVTPVQGAVGNAAWSALQPTGDPTGAATAARNSASLYEKQAADEQRNAQKNAQIANRNYRNEAGLDALAEGALTNTQNRNNYAAETDQATSALRSTVVKPDFNVKMNRSDTQRREGVQNQRAMYNARQEQAAALGDAAADEYVAADRARRNRITAAVSSGGFGAGDIQGDEPVATAQDDMYVDVPTIVIDGETYDGTDIQNGTNAYYGSATRRMNESGEAVQNTPEYNASGREAKAVKLSNYLRSKFGDDQNKVEQYIQGIRKEMTGKENMNTNEDFGALAKGNVPVSFTNELDNNMRR